MNATFFTCGWKPVLVWLCVASFAWAYLFSGIVEAILQYKGIQVTLPKAESMPMFELVLALLGFGGIHSYDRKNGNVRGTE